MATYDVFLSYNPADESAVEEVATQLRERTQLRFFFDQWHLVPGESRISSIERAVDESSTIAVLVGPVGMGARHDEEKQLGLVQAAEEQGKRVIPVLLPGGRLTDITGFLRLRTWVDLGKVGGFMRLLAGISGKKPDEFMDRERAPSQQSRVDPVSRVQTLVAEDRLEVAIRDALIDASTETRDELLVHQATLVRLEKQQRRGLLELGDYERRRKAISYALLDLISVRQRDKG